MINNYENDPLNFVIIETKNNEFKRFSYCNKQILFNFLANSQSAFPNPENFYIYYIFILCFFIVFFFFGIWGHQKFLIKNSFKSFLCNNNLIIFYKI